MLNNRSYKRISKKMKYSGTTVHPKIFIYMRLISSAILFCLLLLTSVYGYLIAPIVTTIYYNFIEYIILDLPITKRKNEIEKDSLEYFQILLLCLKGNNNIKKAINLTNEQINNSLSIEFKKVINDTKIGKTLDEALTLMKERIPSSFVINIIISLIESNRMGNNVSDSIIDQLDYIEDKRKKKIIEHYKMMPLKVAIASMVFVFMVLTLLIICTL